MCKDFPGSPGDKEPTCQCRRRKRPGFHPWVGKIPWRRGWQPTSVLLPGESHGQRSLLGCRPRGRKDSDVTGATRHAGTSGERTPGWPTSYPDNGLSELYPQWGAPPHPQAHPFLLGSSPLGPWRAAVDVVTEVTCWHLWVSLQLTMTHAVSVGKYFLRLKPTIYNLRSSSSVAFRISLPGVLCKGRFIIIKMNTERDELRVNALRIFMTTYISV